MGLENKVRRYYQLKQKQKEIEGELTDLRNDITAHCAQQEVSDWEIGNYRVKIIQQHRKNTIIQSCMIHCLIRSYGACFPSRIRRRLPVCLSSRSSQRSK